MRDMVVVIVNDSAYGGAGGAFAVTSLDPDAVEIAVHELGHSFGNLADEYGGPPPPDCNAAMEPPQPNATMETRRAQIKWGVWIEPNTPIPTTGSTPGVPGLYEGAKYCDKGLFRPTVNSKMRILGRPFEQINSEQLVKQIYNWVKAFDGVEPPDPMIRLREGESQKFRVLPLRPLTHDLDIVWRVDGQPMGTGPDFTLPALAAGSHTVEVVVRDPTPFVRNDPKQVLMDTAKWTVTVVPVKRGVVTQFSGKAQGVGRGPTRTGIGIIGTFLLAGKVDLGAASATLTISNLLNDGNRDVLNVPLNLTVDSSNASTAHFKTAIGPVPIASVTIGDKGGGKFLFRIEVTKATIGPSCPNPTLTTTFKIRGMNPPIDVSTQQPWLCLGTGNQGLESPP